MTGEPIQTRIILMLITSVIWILLRPWRLKIRSPFTGMFPESYERIKRITTPFVAMIILWIIVLKWG